MKKVLITGGSGFVGSNIAIFINKQKPDWNVFCLDNLKRRGSELNVVRLKENGIEFHHGDIRSKEDLKIEKKIDLIIECSAEPSVLAGYGSSPEYLLNTNLVGTLNCLELARRDKADFIFLSTSRVYPIEKLVRLSYKEESTKFVLNNDQPFVGASSDGITTGFPLDGSRSMYGAAKLASELIIQEYVSIYGIRAVINRCGVIAGPWQMGKVDQGVFTHWMLCHYFNKGLQYIGYNGSGKQVRDLLHVDDLSKLVLIEFEMLSEINGRTFNVGGGRDVSLSLLETTTICEEMTGNKMQIGSINQNRSADIPIYITDNSEITKSTGWVIQKSAFDVLHDTFLWIQRNEKRIKQITI